ncbi:unnamed protein product [Enterobius vermicularis]|uniref:RRM domain-containing protein n=1 Tax=Enterobius vermicularis TaxID=51028 RepID=A0A0N4VPK4_ENTVE|nr:unnamed protein product [Enterobius vermicularis]
MWRHTSGTASSVTVVVYFEYWKDALTALDGTQFVYGDGKMVKIDWIVLSRGKGNKIKHVSAWRYFESRA